MGSQECQCPVKASGGCFEGPPRWPRSDPSSHSFPKRALISVKGVRVCSGPWAQAGLGPPAPLLRSQSRIKRLYSSSLRALQGDGRSFPQSYL